MLNFKIMKKRHITLLFIMCIAALRVPAAVSDVPLLRLTLTSTDGWTYHRVGGELSREALQNYRVTLLTTEAGEACTLESPLADCTAADSLRVDLFYRVTDLGYVAAKLALKVDLLNAQGTLVGSTLIPAQADVYEQHMICTLPVPETGSYYLLFSAPKADVADHASVRSVYVYPATRDARSGDVNGDGQVDVADVNGVINAVLGRSALNADVNGDGQVDVADVNAVINLILSN